MLALNFDSVVADILWIRFIQNIPDTHADAVQGEWLARQLTAVVDLDPHFRAAYLGGTALLDVLADQPCDALRILERGVRRFPQDWRQSFQAGFICFYEIADAPCSVRHLRAAADAPDSPRWLPGLVGRLLVEDSQTDAAIDYLRFEAGRATDPRLRERFQERFQEALLTRQLEKLRAALRTWRLRNEGRLPLSLDILVQEGLVPEIPRVDPFGGHYEIGPDGNPRSSTGRTELRAYRGNIPFFKTSMERLTDERVFARIPEVLGRVPWLIFPSDRIHAAGGHFEFVAQALEILDSADPNDDRVQERLHLKARLVLRVEIDRLEAAQLSLLRKFPDRRATIEEIAAEADVPPVGPFGDRYHLDASGRPAAANPKRRPLSVMNEEEGEGGSRACR